MKRHYRLLSIVFLGALSAGSLLAQSYKVAGSIKIPGNGGWDYITADSQNRKLYVSHGTEVDVLDLDSEKVIGQIPGMNHIHGIALANDLDKGFISDGGTNNVVVFDLKSLKVTGKISAGENPDGILYDAGSKRVFVFNGRSKNATVIDAGSGSVAQTLSLDGKPEFPVDDGKGNVYVNIEDKSEIEKIDAKSMNVTEHWSLAPCESPSGLAIDKGNRRLFSVCDNKLMAVVDADSGKVLATPAIGEGPDAAGFDPESKLAFSSNGETGTLTVVKENGKNQFSVAQTLKTADGARTMAIDEKTHKIYLPTADLGAATGGAGHARRSMVPGTFRLIVVSP
ncbi:MAG: YncE family protein [Acidobacteriaceae bacterium]|nr:YncE family protein [Acidobacteriaceae bacterium]